MKIVKEVYGVGSLSEPISFYYVMFSEIPAQDDIFEFDNRMQKTLAAEDYS